MAQVETTWREALTTVETGSAVSVLEMRLARQRQELVLSFAGRHGSVTLRLKPTPHSEQEFLIVLLLPVQSTKARMAKGGNPRGVSNIRHVLSNVTGTLDMFAISNS